VPYRLGMPELPEVETVARDLRRRLLPPEGVDAPGPTITGASASPNSLWPPNHTFSDVTVAYTTSDNCSLSTAITCALSAASNEPLNGTGDGDTAPDWVIVDSHHLKLRAERAGTGSGRVYTITATCTDPFRNSSSKSTTVTVAK